MDTQLYISGDWVAIGIGWLLGSIITILPISLLLFYAYKLLKKKEPQIQTIVLIALCVALALDLFEKELSLRLFLIRAIAAFIISTTWIKIKEKKQKRNKEAI